MRELFYIAGKELRSYFVTPVAYIVIGFWFAIVSLFFYLGVSNNQASLGNVFGVMIIFMLFALPILTMRLLAEESRTGTLELLMTAPVKDWAVVIGKYIGVLGLYVAMIGVTLFYPLILALLKGTPDWGSVWSGYLGILMFGMVGLAIGLFTSALTSNQIASAAVGWVIMVILFVIGNLGGSSGSGVGDFFHKLSINDRMQSFQSGVIDLKDVIYYLSFAALLLFLTVQVVDARRYRA